MGEIDNPAYRIDRAEGIRNVRERDDAGVIVEHRLVATEQELALVGHRHHAEARAFLLAQQLPRHDVRMVLHHRDDDLVAAAQVSAPVGVGDQVDGLGGAADEDDLLRIGSVEKARHRPPRGLVGVGRPLAEQVHAAVHVGVLPGVIANQPVQHHLRLLRRRGVVEINQRLAMDLRAEDRKVPPDARHVERGRRE